MDISYPSRSVVPTLDGVVLAVLARTTRPLTVNEVHQVAGTGSVNGVRKALGRLVREGTVHAEERAVAVFYEANREHLAWPAVEILAGLRRVMLERIRAELGSWQPGPLHASLFGSAARGDGDSSSDIDILLVRPDGVDEDEEAWADQIDRLRRHVEAWTGNYCQPFQLDLERLTEHVDARDPLVDDWRRDEITLAGDSLYAFLPKQPHHRGDR